MRPVGWVWSPSFLISHCRIRLLLSLELKLLYKIAHPKSEQNCSLLRMVSGEEARLNRGLNGGILSPIPLCGLVQLYRDGLRRSAGFRGLSLRAGQIRHGAHFSSISVSRDSLHPPERSLPGIARSGCVCDRTFPVLRKWNACDWDSPSCQRACPTRPAD